MRKKKKTLLEIKLYAQYYRKDITDRYAIVNSSLVVDNDAIDILDKPQEKLYIEPLIKSLRKDEELKRLNNNWSELREFILNHYIVGHLVQNSTLDNILKKMNELEEGGE